MISIKFRQPRMARGKFQYWHYWGYIDDKPGHFVAPLPLNTGGDSYQSTGLKDKNGKELDWWEGDLIIHESTRVIYEIFRHEEEGQWCARRINFISDKKEYKPLWRFVGRGYEVIHENPELLEEKK